MGYPPLYGLLICTEGHWGPVPLQGIAVSVAVRGFVAQVKATLRYRNELKSPMEVMFKCPVDEGSAVYHVEAKLDDRTIVGRCLEKKKAEEVYKDAVAAGRTALLVKEDVRTADVISLALGNLPPESTAEVALSLVCHLTVAADGGVQFTLPTLLNPRYNPAGGPVGDPEASAGTGYVMSVSKPYNIEVTATVTGGQTIARVISHSDPINVAMDDDSSHAKITLDSGAFRTDHDWSFVVYYNNPYQPHAIVETGDSTELSLMKDQVLMINLFPELPEGSYSHYNEVIFIIDRSGSMGGPNITNARAVLLLFLKSLPPGCRFNIISFGNSHSLLFPEGSREYNEANLSLALKLHEEMDADMGGTEILQPLKTVYSKPADPEYSRQILLLTDGQVYNVDQVTELAERNAGNTRVFTVGIGDGASTALVKGLARAGGGRSELVTQRDRMQTKVMGLVSSMLQSSVRKVSISCDLDPPARLRLVPDVPPVIFAGQHLITYARMPPNTQLKSVKLTGSVDGSPWSASLKQEHVKTVHDASLALHRLAAKALIQHSYTDDSDGVKEDVIAVSTSCGVLSRYSALVAVDQDGQAFQAPQRSEVSTMNQRLFFPPKLVTRSLASASRCQRDCAVALQPVMYDSVDCSMRSFESESDDDCELILEEDHVDCTDTKSAGKSLEKVVSSPEVVFQNLIICQKFDGSWKLDDVAMTLAVDRCDLRKGEAEVPDESTLATGIAIVVLQEGFGDRKEEWQLLANKAMGYLQQKLGAQKDLKSRTSLESLLENLKQMLECLRQKYPSVAAVMAKQ